MIKLIFLKNHYQDYHMNKIKVPAIIYSRVSGYFSPVAGWNKAKKEEFLQRKMLKFNLDNDERGRGGPSLSRPDAGV